MVADEAFNSAELILMKLNINIFYKVVSPL
jgi:hypothetical protein